MPSWYDIKGLDDRAEEDCKGIQESRDLVLQLLKHEKDTYGLDDSKLFIGGFSQGGALSIYTGTVILDT